MFKPRNHLPIALCASISLTISACESKEIRVDKSTVIQSIDYGRFPWGLDPTNVPSNKVKFEVLPVAVANRTGYMYGYRIKFKCSGPTVKLFTSYSPEAPAPLPNQGVIMMVSNGAVYHTWHLEGVRNGKYFVRIWINNIEVPRVNYKVDFH